MRGRLGDRDREDQRRRSPSSTPMSGVERRLRGRRSRGRRSARSATAWPARRAARTRSRRRRRRARATGGARRGGGLWAPALTRPARRGGRGWRRRRRGRAWPARARSRAACASTCSATRTRPSCLQPARAAGLLVLLGGGVGDDERRDAGADEVERGVVAALADARRARWRSSATRSGTARMSSTLRGRDALAARRSRPAGISGPAIARIGVPVQALRSPPRAAARPTRPPPALTTTWSPRSGARSPLRPVTNPV